MPVGDESLVGVQTLYMHTESGEWITSTIKSPIAEAKGMNMYQSIGSAITYFRRYSLSAFVGIASDEDIDASGPAKEPDELSKEQVKQVMKLANDTKDKALYDKICIQIDDKNDIRIDLIHDRFCTFKKYAKVMKQKFSNNSESVLKRNYKKGKIILNAIKKYTETIFFKHLPAGFEPGDKIY